MNIGVDHCCPAPAAAVSTEKDAPALLAMEGGQLEQRKIGDTAIDIVQDDGLVGWVHERFLIKLRAGAGGERRRRGGSG